jgi:hypothetical protein
VSAQRLVAAEAGEVVILWLLTAVCAGARAHDRVAARALLWAARIVAILAETLV